MSVDPAMRPQADGGPGAGRGDDGRRARPRRAVEHAGFAVGDLVTNRLGFREYFTSDGKGLTKLTPDPDLPLTVHMHALGGTGFTAYGGLLHIGQLKDGEQVFVSTAAGAVGSVAAQIAKIKGCYVVGSTGSDDKAAWLRDEVGLDAVINYKTQPIRQALEDGHAQGPRRLFRQRRRRPPGRGAAADEHAGPHPGLRLHLRLQLRPLQRLEPVQHHLCAGDAARLRGAPTSCTSTPTSSATWPAG